MLVYSTGMRNLGYSDRHTILRSPKAGAGEGEDDNKKGKPLSNFGKGLKDLGIGQIFATCAVGPSCGLRQWIRVGPSKMMVHCEGHGLVLHPILQLAILKDCTDTGQGPAAIRRPAHPVVLLPIGYNQIIGLKLPSHFVRLQYR